MEKEPVRVLTPFQCDGTKTHWEPQRAREYHLKSLFFPFPFLFFPFLLCVYVWGVCVCNKIISFNLNEKIMKKEPVRMLAPF